MHRYLCEFYFKISRKFEVLVLIISIFCPHYTNFIYIYIIYKLKSLYKPALIVGYNVIFFQKKKLRLYKTKKTSCFTFYIFSLFVYVNFMSQVNSSFIHFSSVLFVKAKIRQGPPVPPIILIGCIISLNPFDGNVVPFRATFSRLYMLALDSILCTSNDVELPASTLGLSTPTPNTFLESTIHYTEKLCVEYHLGLTSLCTPNISNRCVGFQQLSLSTKLPKLRSTHKNTSCAYLVPIYQKKKKTNHLNY
ncbi:hypothetical protein AGLY_006681 [Aphis glycines]|uniref:Uncharacterized protein n=1 Tax=Aphis glycines TaxID=307491 RepID=A0A6G0TT20_APHGL|nr:hypothetical protein AGLY_006681 [Aphis glycines]